MAELCSSKAPKVENRWREGDTLPEIGFVLPAGQLVSAFPTLELRVARPDGTVLVKPAVDLGGSRGKFVWADTDLQAGENQRCEIHRVDVVSDEYTTQAFLICVDPRVGT